MQNFSGLSKKDYVKLRISNHSLLVETKRYSRPKILRENRICEFCHLNEVEDETHLLFYCPQHTTFRGTFMDKMKAIQNTFPEDKDSCFENIFCTNNEHAFFYLMNYINPQTSKGGGGGGVKWTPPPPHRFRAIKMKLSIPVV